MSELLRNAILRHGERDSTATRIITCLFGMRRNPTVADLLEYAMTDKDIVEWGLLGFAWKRNIGVKSRRIIENVLREAGYDPKSDEVELLQAGSKIDSKIEELRELLSEYLARKQGS